MSRSRNIKPGFFENDLLGEIHPLGRLLFAGLWTIADREGRLEDRPKRIKAQILPYDDCNVDDLLEELKNRDFIVKYLVDGTGFIQINNWKKHQQPHVKECASTIPAPDEHGASTILAPDEHGSSMEEESLIPDSLNLIPDSLTTTTTARGAAVVGGAAKSKRKPPIPRLNGYAPETAEVVNWICENWPRSQPKDGQAIRLDIAKTAVRVDQILRTSNVTAPVLISACRHYLEDSPPTLFKAPQYFLGEQNANGQGANWFEHAQIVFHMARKGDAA